MQLSESIQPTNHVANLPTHQFSLALKPTNFTSLSSLFLYYSPVTSSRLPTQQLPTRLINQQPANIDNAASALARPPFLAVLNNSTNLCVCVLFRASQQLGGCYFYSRLVIQSSTAAAGDWRRPAAVRSILLVGWLGARFQLTPSTNSSSSSNSPSTMVRPTTTPRRTRMNNAEGLDAKEGQTRTRRRS